MAIATGTAIAISAAVAAASAGVSLYQAQKAKKNIPTLLDAPKAPVVPSPVVPKDPIEAKRKAEEIKAAEKKKIRGGRQKRGTILTGPRGILSEPVVGKKTLLGG